MKDFNIFNDMINFDLRKFNTITKYPSISTYHEIKNNLLQNNLTSEFTFNSSDELFVTEKIDGTNARIIFCNGDYIIGSRDELIHAKGDRIINYKELINSTILQFITDLNFKINSKDKIVVVYCEVFGGNINGWKCYTNNKSISSFRIFDIVEYELSRFIELFKIDIEFLSTLRENNRYQQYLNYTDLSEFCQNLKYKMTPLKAVIDPCELPTDMGKVYFDFLKRFVKTDSILDVKNPKEIELTNSVYGRSEGVVIRNNTRTFIRKLRFDDYQRSKIKKVF